MSETEEASEPSRVSTLITETDEAYETAHTALLTSEEIAERTSTAGTPAAWPEATWL